MRLVTIFAVALALASTAAAQRGGFSGGHSFSPAARAPQPSFLQGSHSSALGRQGLGRFNRSPYGSLLLPLLGDDFGVDDSSGTSSVSDSPMMLLQAMREMQGLRGQRNLAPEPPPGEPLMIELRGDQYVRVNSPAIDGEAKPLAPQENHATPTRPNIAPQSSKAKPPASGATVQETATLPRRQELPSAILIFRDGHHEEVRDYTIADGMLYARGDLYTDGYWNKKIALASLNLPQTLQANADRNVKFALPSSPNEVIARF